MAVVEKVDLENAKVDTDDLGAILNSDSSTTVTTRLGLTVKSVAKAIGEISAYDDKGAWLTSTGYVIKDLVQESGITYICTVAHTSGTFATDKTAGKWGVFQTQLPEVLLSEYASLSAAITAIGTSEVTLVIDKNDVLIGALIIPANVSLRPINGAVITISTYTLTLNGELIAAPAQQVFNISGGGSIVGLGYKTPQWFGAVADGTTDDHTPLQYVIDLGGPVTFPDGYYGISEVLQVRNNKKLSLIGSKSARPNATIVTVSGFTDRSMLRNWDETWYTGGETDRDVPPADLTAYSGSVDRYININNMGFNVNHDAGGRVTPIDLVAQQETSQINNVVFDGTATTKGVPIRGRATSTGSEISFNGWKISNIVVYGAGWERELFIDGLGSDVRLTDWVTSPADHAESPFYINVINFVIDRLHAEAYSTGNPTFDLEGTDTRVINSFVGVRDGSGDIFKVTNPFGSGNGRSGCLVSGLRVYPEGGNWANVTNVSTINLMNDTSLSENTVVPLVYDDAGTDRLPSMVYNLDPTRYKFTDGGTGLVFDLPLIGPYEKFIRTDAERLTGSTYNIVWDKLATDNCFVTCHWSAGSKYGSAGNDYFNNPQSGRMTFYTSYNGSEIRQKDDIYTDRSPALISIASWSRSTGTVVLNIDQDLTDLRIHLVAQRVE